MSAASSRAVTPAPHTYLRTHTLAADALSFSLRREDAALRVRARAAASGRRARW